MTRFLECARRQFMGFFQTFDRSHLPAAAVIVGVKSPSARPVFTVQFLAQWTAFSKSEQLLECITHWTQQVLKNVWSIVIFIFFINTKKQFRNKYYRCQNWWCDYVTEVEINVYFYIFLQYEQAHLLSRPKKVNICFLRQSVPLH